MLLALFAAVTLLLHFLTNGRYGFWVDELYFIACGEHLDWGYVDQPPFVALVAKASRVLLGDSLFAIRFFSAVAAALLVTLTGVMARRFGGGRFAMTLAMLCVMVVPVYLLFGNLLTMNSFEPLFWTACAYLVVRMIEHGRRQLWLVFGLAAGIGLMNKYSIAFFAGALVAGLLLTSQRKVLFSRWLPLGGAVAGLIFLPHVVWEASHGWPTIELLRNARQYQFQPVTPLEFIGQQVLLMSPLMLPVWLAGLWFLLRSRTLRPLGWSFLILFGLFAAIQAKNYYLAPVYPMLFAAGAVGIEQLSRASVWAWLRLVLPGAVVLSAIVTAPYVLPVLPVEMVPAYMRVIGIKEPRPERRQAGELPQIFSDMLGWEERVAAVARVYRGLPPEEKSRCAIWGTHFGHAGAVDFYGPAFGLPNAISGHQNYYLWGTRGYTGEVMITVGFPTDALQPLFDQVELADVVHCEYCMPDNRDVPIHLCRGMKIPLADFWPQAKCYTCDRPAFMKGR